ncbi:hypothetical protein SYNPS1DRAFT_26424 [Syncephalis pseudoplumigaleata]|uniref:Uncharacterized protein n=1 Tax=Syncephalis pseudoplumigaleata TaxID=1712513 RepID=A0A4P9Z5Q5_9FUNG|nr:hypothetical protein SYNPS1DRAFT_26424 [Syncephalis pseudoplumigaleata]|eukprot:RKP27963.1 hypothetical protein SYNPS1DRAFT_26424 [Syncephalis pseudoplumigaleata]
MTAFVCNVSRDACPPLQEQISYSIPIHQSRAAALRAWKQARPAICCVCARPTSSSPDRPLLTCATLTCDVVVHQGSHGAFYPLGDVPGGWIHTICARTIPGVIVQAASDRGCRAFLTRIPIEYWQSCTLCSEVIDATEGVCIPCGHRPCPHRCHATCGYVNIGRTTTIHCPGHQRPCDAARTRAWQDWSHQYEQLVSEWELRDFQLLERHGLARQWTRLHRERMHEADLLNARRLMARALSRLWHILRPLWSPANPIDIHTALTAQEQHQVKHLQMLLHEQLCLLMPHRASTQPSSSFRPSLPSTMMDNATQSARPPSSSPAYDETSHVDREDSVDTVTAAATTITDDHPTIDDAHTTHSPSPLSDASPASSHRRRRRRPRRRRRAPPPTPAYRFTPRSTRPLLCTTCQLDSASTGTHTDGPARVRKSARRHVVPAHVAATDAEVKVTWGALCSRCHRVLF